MSSVEPSSAIAGDPGRNAEVTTLTDRDRELIRKVFSEPLEIPIEWFAWLKAKLESDPPLLTTSAIFGLAGALSGAGGGHAVGDTKISAQPATHAAQGGGTWYLADGSAIPGAETELIALLGANVPDARGRALVALGTHADVNAIGDNDGVAVGSRRFKHVHLITDHTHPSDDHSHFTPDHNHPMNQNSIGPVAGGGAQFAVEGGTVSTGGGGGGTSSTKIGGAGNTGAINGGAPNSGDNGGSYVVPGSLFYFGSGD